MKRFDCIFAAVTAVIFFIFAAANIVLLRIPNGSSDRPYRVEIERLVREIEQNGTDSIDLSECRYVTHIEKINGEFYVPESDFTVREINGTLYRFDYSAARADNTPEIVTVNIALGAMALLNLAVMLFIRRNIIKPFNTLSEVPYELSKGNLTAAVKENESRFFGRFNWGMDLLRENLEQQKKRELELQKERRTLLLSLSHDLKTPLSAIKLYSKALSKGLYPDPQKQAEIADSINEKADEIEEYISRIIAASREDFFAIDVNNGEFYLSELTEKISGYYSEKLRLVGTDFIVGKYENCILNGDIDRSVEVIQNIMENAVKYGDGKKISLEFSQEDGCVLITVVNTGSSLSNTELPHIFDSFWRAANAANTSGSGLGLYICRQIMRKMNGEIFAEIHGDKMSVTAVFPKA